MRLLARNDRAIHQPELGKWKMSDEIPVFDEWGNKVGKFVPTGSGLLDTLIIIIVFLILWTVGLLIFLLVKMIVRGFKALFHREWGRAFLYLAIPGALILTAGIWLTNSYNAFAQQKRPPIQQVQQPQIQQAQQPQQQTPPTVTTKFPVSVIQEKFAIRFTIDKAELNGDHVDFHITIQRTGSDALPWFSDKGNLANIFLRQSDGQIFRAVDVNGVLAEDSELQPGETYQGVIVFSKPSGKSVTFNYPEMKSTSITLP